ncbi:MAG: TRAP transporter substrate-binding protein DctP [Roseovarius sp.]|jgi:TRAP-type mannitol/chloroaromatic compound transport system substrate-binding protein|nr:TRAP transporter substrate-binding protein DctP [Roseovarius sp.]
MTRMTRRAFGRTALTGGAATLAAPALAQTQPEYVWRMTSSFPRALDTIFGTSEHFRDRIAELTEGRMKIEIFAPGEIVGGLQALDAATEGTVEMAHTGSYYFVGKNEAFAFGTSVPFGLNTRQQNAWLYQGGGIDICNDFYKGYNLIGLPFGNTGAQMGGWFRREINTVDDLKGLKLRVGGFAGRVFARLGAVPQQIAGGDVYPALERGTIDAAEWVGPYDDEKLGFAKVAPYYYAPGWWEGSTTIHLFINLDAWNALPPFFKTAIATAAAEADLWTITKYDALNPDAITRLIQQGAQLRWFSEEIMGACYEATQAVMTETAEANAEFRKIYDQWKAFQAKENFWFQVAEVPFERFVYQRSRDKG